MTKSSKENIIINQGHCKNQSITYRYFSGNRVITKAIRHIAKGEIVPENYGQHYASRTKSQRRNALLDRYWFECSCEVGFSWYWVLWMVFKIMEKRICIIGKEVFFIVDFLKCMSLKRILWVFYCIIFWQRYEQKY